MHWYSYTETGRINNRNNERTAFQIYQTTDEKENEVRQSPSTISSVRRKDKDIRLKKEGFTAETTMGRIPEDRER